MARVVGLLRNLGGLAIAGGIASEFCMYDVDAGNRVVIFDRIQGVLPEIYPEGTHFKLPWQVRSMVYSKKDCSIYWKMHLFGFLR